MKIVLFRGFPACECLAEWLPFFEKELLARGLIKYSIDIAQLIGQAEASANTHQAGAFDIWQTGREVMWVARQMGAPACWDRTTGSFANNKHTHGVLRGCPHLHQEAIDQIKEVYAGGDGLRGFVPDHGPRPIPNRTWKQGIEWHKVQVDHRRRQARIDRLRARRARITRIIHRIKETL